MVEPLDSAALAWPIAFSCAIAAAAQRHRERRLRDRLNRALHELRRPLQALALAGAGSRAADDGLELALAALGGLDRELNGGADPSCRCTVEARRLVEDAVARWRPQAALARRPLRLSWRANGSVVLCDRAAVSRALDNLIANSLEHGRGSITVEAVARERRLRVVVADGGGGRAAVPAPLRRRDPRRGHGLRVVAEVAAAHGGRFASCRHPGGATAVIELPLSGP